MLGGLISRKEVARRLGVSVATLYRRRQAGFVPEPVTQVGYPKWRSDDIELFLIAECDMGKFRRLRRERDRQIRNRQAGIIPPEPSV